MTVNEYFEIKEKFGKYGIKCELSELRILTTSKEEYEQLLRELLRLETETMIEIKRRM